MQYQVTAPTNQPQATRPGVTPGSEGPQGTDVVRDRDDAAAAECGRLGGASRPIEGFPCNFGDGCTSITFGDVPASTGPA
jgi:hypothetical protein